MHSWPEIEKEVKSFTDSDKGRKFLARIEKARRFKRCKGLMLEELECMALLHGNNLINGSFDLYRLAYLQGYEAAKRDARRK